MNMKWVSIGLKGMAMGMAEVVPGVSGGTLAFITGIYEELLLAIKGFGPKLIPIYRQNGFSGVWKEIHGSFLVALLFGMVIGIILGVFGISWLIEHHPKGVWSFFFGLILASAWWVSRSATKYGLWEWVVLLAAAIVAYAITIASPATGNEALWFVFVSGIIAISAMLLPGVSGSFLLLLMGMYTMVLGNVEGLLRTGSMDNFMVVFVFGLGCLVGLAGSARVLSWVFANYRNMALALLTGFMMGSLNRLWPWKHVISYRLNSHGEEVPLLEESVLPHAYEGEPQLALVIISILLGFLVVWGIDRLSSKPTQHLEV